MRNDAFEAVFSLEALMEKAEALKQRQFRPGFDRMTADAAMIWLRVNGKHLLTELAQGQYQPQPAVGYNTAKKSGGVRCLSRLTAIDTVIQSCMLEKLTEITEPRFSDSSFAYRRGRGVGVALQRFCEYSDRYPYAAKADPKACFDSIDHEVLREALQGFTDESTDFLIRLCLRYAAMPLYMEGEIIERRSGILQGAPISPVLCNIYLHALDRQLEENGIPFVRYADDIAVFGRTPAETTKAVDGAARMMTDKLHLCMNERKCMIATPADLIFLGHRFSRDRRGMVALKADEAPEGAYYSWYQSRIRNTRRTVDILSDGILRQKDYAILFEGADRRTELPPGATELINIYSSVVFDAGFLETAFRNGIYVNVLDRHGAPIGSFTPNVPLKAPQLVYTQLEHYYDAEKRLKLAKEFVLASVHNLVLNIRYYHKQKPNDIYELTLGAVKQLKERIKACTDYEKLLMMEALVRKEYYSCFDHFMGNSDMVFEKRTRRPPENEINALLSFGNTVLYNRLACRIGMSPLDGRIGYLHATNGRRMDSLNLDIAEIFKPLVVDRVIFRMVNRGVVRRDHFFTEDGGVWLTNDGKRVFLRDLYEKLDETLTVGARRMSYYELMEEELRKLVRYFRHGERYRAFRQTR